MNLNCHRQAAMIVYQLSRRQRKKPFDYAPASKQRSRVLSPSGKPSKKKMMPVVNTDFQSTAISQPTRMP